MPEFIIHGVLFGALVIIGFKVTEIVRDRWNR